MLDISRIAIKDKEALYSPYGYLITEDGYIYSLTVPYVHGTLLALLHPELAKEQGYELPDEDYDVYHYQRFELDNHDRFTTIRISISSLTGSLNVNKGTAPATSEQIESLTKVMREYGVKLNDEVMSDFGLMSLNKLMKKMNEEEVAGGYNTIDKEEF